MVISPVLRGQLMSFVNTLTANDSIELGKDKLGFTLGYYLGNAMSLNGDLDDSYATRFSKQYNDSEAVLLTINEFRPLNFEMTKDLARSVFVARSRIAQGGISNLQLPANDLLLLDFAKMIQVVLKDDTAETHASVVNGMNELAEILKG